MSTNSTTIATVTKSQIRRLRTEAAEAGDSIQVEVCDLAMGALGEEREDSRCVAALTECVRVIADAEAQS